MEKQQIWFVKFALILLNPNNMCLYWIGYGWGQEGGWWHECTLLGELHGGCRKIFLYNICFHSVKSTKITWNLCGCVMWWCVKSQIRTPFIMITSSMITCQQWWTSKACSKHKWETKLRIDYMERCFHESLFCLLALSLKSWWAVNTLLSLQQTLQVMNAYTSFLFILMMDCTIDNSLLFSKTILKCVIHIHFHWCHVQRRRWTVYN